MKIHYFSGATLPSKAAKSVHIMKMCEAWGKMGFDVTLFAKGRDDAYDFYGVENCFKISCAPNIRLPFLSGLVRIAHNLYAASKGGKAEIIYGRDPVALAFQAGQVIFEAHQMPYLLAHKWALKKLNRIVVISEALKKDMLTEYLDKEIFVAHGGANLSHALPIPLKSPGKFNIGYAGSVQDGKGTSTILELARAVPNFTFHIFGGHLSAPNIQSYGYVPHKEIAGCLKACDVLIAPYKGKATIKTGQNIARWISPMKIFEYMSTRKPIICSNLPVIREVLENGKNALLVPPEDIEAWSRALKAIYEDKALAETLAQNAYEDLKTKYLWDIRARNIMEFIMHQTRTDDNLLRSAAR